MNALLEPFSYEYMLNAMWVSAMVGGLCAFLSCYLMLKGWSLIGDALSHSIVPGVAGAYMLGLPFSLGAFFSGGLPIHRICYHPISTTSEDSIVRRPTEVRKAMEGRWEEVRILSCKKYVKSITPRNHSIPALSKVHQLAAARFCIQRVCGFIFPRRNFLYKLDTLTSQ